MKREKFLKMIDEKMEEILKLLQSDTKANWLKKMVLINTPSFFDFSKFLIFLIELITEKVVA